MTDPNKKLNPTIKASLGCLTASALVAFGVIGCIGIKKVGSSEETFTVSSKERVAGKKAEDKAQYLAHIEFENGEKEVVRIADSTLFFTFNASDRYFGLKDGKSYTGHFFGMRVPYYSAYRNLVKYEEADSTTPSPEYQRGFDAGYAEALNELNRTKTK